MKPISVVDDEAIMSESLRDWLTDDGKPVLPKVKIPYAEIEALMKKEAVTPS